MEIAKSAAAQAATASVGDITGAFDKDEFLKILVAQLQHQDPLSPVGNQDFMAQVAQLTTVEQVANMSQQLKSFTNVQMLSHANNLIGTEVRVYDPLTEQFESGVVDKVRVDKGGGVKILINDREYDLDNITESFGKGGSRTGSDFQAQLLAYANTLVGSKVTVPDFDSEKGETITSYVDKVRVKENGEVRLVIDDKEYQLSDVIEAHGGDTTGLWS